MLRRLKKLLSGPSLQCLKCCPNIHCLKLLLTFYILKKKYLFERVLFGSMTTGLNVKAILDYERYRNGREVSAENSGSK